WHFFFQAEDGIRDFHVTGVQTCALPIFDHDERGGDESYLAPQQTEAAVDIAGEDAEKVVDDAGAAHGSLSLIPLGCGGRRRSARSEERRVGEECEERVTSDERTDRMMAD